jgi:hypothetical protein
MTTKLHINIPVPRTSGLGVTVESSINAPGELITALKTLRRQLGEACHIVDKHGVLKGRDVDELSEENLEMALLVEDWIIRLGGLPDHGVPGDEKK